MKDKILSEKSCNANNLATFVKNVAKSAEIEARRSGLSGELRNAEAFQFVPFHCRPSTHTHTHTPTVQDRSTALIL